LKIFYGFEYYNTCILSDVTTKVIMIIMMHVVYRKELEPLRKIVANDGKPLVEGDHGKAAVERLLTVL
jgi:hypothetical protein